MKDTTLCILTREVDGRREILLAMKKRGFGEGKWNGVGGKLEPNEDIETGIIRETKEEIGVRIRKFEKMANLVFVFDNPEWDQNCHVFLASEWDPEPRETEEMKPAWYDVNDIPFDRMWPDDKHWLPLILAGAKISARFTFSGEKGEVIKDFSLREVQKWE